MNPRRFAQVTALCGTVGLAGWVVASLTGVGSVGIENAGAVSTEDHLSPPRSWTHRRQRHRATSLSLAPK
jgi:hypothetical protein